MWYMILWLVVAPNSYTPTTMIAAINQRDCEITRDMVNSGTLQPKDPSKEFVAECFQSTVSGQPRAMGDFDGQTH